MMQANHKWIVVTAVVLMLMGMFAYVMSDDESLEPAPPTPPAAQQVAQ